MNEYYYPALVIGGVVGGYILMRGIIHRTVSNELSCIVEKTLNNNNFKNTTKKNLDEIVDYVSTNKYYTDKIIEILNNLNNSETKKIINDLLTSILEDHNMMQTVKVSLIKLMEDEKICDSLSKLLTDASKKSLEDPELNKSLEIFAIKSINSEPVKRNISDALVIILKKILVPKYFVN